MKNSVQCIIYGRVSSLKQTTKGAGLSSQIRTCQEYARRRGYEVARVFTDTISGKEGDRPGVSAMLNFLIENGSSNYVVIVDDVSRMARDVIVYANLKQQAVARGATIESPSQKFGDDASGRFAEIMTVALAQYERERLAEQKQRRCVARLQNGFWIFKEPLGYSYSRAPGGGKMLVPVEPLASIIREGMEGFATGRFASQAELKRFWESKPDFPKKKNGKISYDVVKRILTNLLYAGQLSFPKWRIPLTSAAHTALISLATFEEIQRRLLNNSVAPAKSNINQDFPLRGLLLCEECGYVLTACWAKSHTGKKYPYYLCQKRGCANKGKSMKRERVEREFETFLQRLTPSAALFEQCSATFKTAWNKRDSQVKAKTYSLRGQKRRVQSDIQNIVDDTLRTRSPSLKARYEARLSELELEAARIDEQLAELGDSQPDFDDVFKLATDFLANPYKIWEKGSFSVKRTVLKPVFAEPVVFGTKSGLQTPKTTIPFKALALVSSVGAAMVGDERLELPTSSV